MGLVPELSLVFCVTGHQCVQFTNGSFLSKPCDAGGDHLSIDRGRRSRQMKTSSLRFGSLIELDRRDSKREQNIQMAPESTGS